MICLAGLVGASLLGWGSRSLDDGSCYTRYLGDLDVPEATFTGPDLTTFLGLDALGLTAVGQLLTSTRAIVECRMPIGFEDPFCRACGAQGVSRGTVARHLVHVPVGWRPTQLLVRMRRFACTHCRRMRRQDTGHLHLGRAQDPADPLSRGLGDAGPCPGAHVRLPGSSRPGGTPGSAGRRFHDPRHHA